MKLQVVYETEKRAAALSVQIVIRLSDDFGARQTSDRRSNGAPSLCRRHRKLKR
jgi:hypothetical protein